MQSISIARELALLVLGQISEENSINLENLSLEALLNKGLNSLTDYWRESLDNCASELSIAQEKLLDSELQQSDQESLIIARSHVKFAFGQIENILNALSVTIDFPRLIALSDQETTRKAALKRVALVIQQRKVIDAKLNDVMEGWRLHRLARIDRDILRIAFIDLTSFKVPAPIVCNEAVELANKYSDEQGRRMINGILRRLQNEFCIDNK